MKLLHVPICSTFVCVPQVCASICACMHMYVTMCMCDFLCECVQLLDREAHDLEIIFFTEEQQSNHV